MLGLGDVADRRCRHLLRRPAPPPRPGRSARSALPASACPDEPTTGLDPAGRSRGLGRGAQPRRRLAPTSCSPPTTSRKPTSSRTRSVVIDHGKAIAAGSTAELKARDRRRDVIEVVLADSAQLGAAAAVLETLTASPAVIDHTGRRARSQASDGTAQLSAAIAALDRARMPVSEIALRHPTLDEVFRTLTDTKADSLR